MAHLEDPARWLRAYRDTMMKTSMAILKSLNLLTYKPTIYAANVGRG